MDARRNATSGRWTADATNSCMSSSNEVPALISNVEVLRLLQKRLTNRKQGGGNRRKFQHRDWVESQVATYLQCTPCAKLDPQKYPQLQKLLQSQKKHVYAIDSQKSTGFGLTEAETIQVLNLMPTEPVEIHLLIEDLHSRMPEKQQEELLQVISSYRIETTADADCDQPLAVVASKESTTDEAPMIATAKVETEG